MWLSMWLNRQRQRRNDDFSEQARSKGPSIARRRRSSRGTADNHNLAVAFDFPTIRLHPLRRHGNSESNISSNNNSSSNDETREIPRTSMPLLYNLARSWAWEAVRFRCQTHPNECSELIVDHRGDNVLHWTVFGRPSIEVVSKLLEVCPELARRPNQQGYYPLHVASSYRASDSVIQALLDAYPEAAAIPSSANCFVVHLLCDYGTTPQALCSILQTEAGVSTVTKLDPTYQRRALHILNGRKNMQSCQRARDDMRKLRRSRIRMYPRDSLLGQMGASVHMESCIPPTTQLDPAFDEYAQQDMWKKVSLLLVAEYTQRPLPANALEDLPPQLVLHAAMAIPDCPASFQEYAILLYQDYLLHPNEQGDLALHLAVKRRGDTGLLLDLLEARPEAAAVRNVANDALPLQLALMHESLSSSLGQHGTHKWHWEDGLGALIEAYPAALQELDLADGLYPRIWSRLSSQEALFQAIWSCPRMFTTRAGL